MCIMATALKIYSSMNPESNFSRRFSIRFTPTLTLLVIHPSISQNAFSRWHYWHFVSTAFYARVAAFDARISARVGVGIRWF